MAARTVKADVGGDLKIQSLQDTSTYASEQSSTSAGVSVCLPPLCYGASSVSGSTGKSKIDGNFASVTEQSGLKAGDGGFAVAVKNTTDFKGGAITSTGNAVNEGRNSFTTGRSLTTGDIQNRADYQGDSYSLNASLGFKAGDQSSAATPEQVAGFKAAPLNSGSAGVGNDKGSAASTTQAAISGGAGNKEARTGDAQSGIQKIFNAAKVQREIDAQVQITAEFGKQASKAVGDYAQKKYDELKSSAPAEAQKWAEGGVYRSLAHSVIGGLTGGMSGAAGAGLAALSADAINKATDKLPEGVKSVVGAAIATGIGVVAGSAAGAASAFNSDMNNRQLHPTEKQRIKDMAGGDAQKEARLTAAACALTRCYAEYPEGSPAYNALKFLAQQGASESYADEQRALQQQTGLFNYSTGGLLNDRNSDALKQLNNSYQLDVRAIGAGQTLLGAAGLAGAIASAPASCATGVGCAANAFVAGTSVDALYAGAKQTLSGQSEAAYLSQALQSLGLSPQAAAYAEAALGIGAAAKVGAVLNTTTEQIGKLNILGKASYSDFTPAGLKVTPELMVSPQAQSMIGELRAGSPGLSAGRAADFVKQLLESGSALPSPVTAAPGSVLIKVVPKGEGVTPYTPYWMSTEQARAVATMTPEQAGKALGLPAEQAWKILNGGVDFYAITPKVGVMPKVFVSDIAGTGQGSVTNAASGQQVIVSNRSLWTEPKQINPLTLR